MSVQKLQELEYVATQADVEFNTLTGSMSRFTMKLKEAINPQTKTAQVLDAMGISIKDSNGLMKSREQLFMETVMATGKLTDETTQALAASELFGRSFADLLPLMKLGEDGIRRLSDRYKGLGMALTDEQIAQLDKFADKSAEMKLRVQRAFAMMAADSAGSLAKLTAFAENTLIPALGKLIDKVGELIQKFGELDPQTQKFLLWGVGIVAALGPVLSMLGNLSLTISGITKAAAALGTTIGGLIAALGPLAYLSIPLGMWDDPNAKGYQEYIEKMGKARREAYVKQKQIGLGIIDQSGQRIDSGSNDNNTNPLTDMEAMAKRIADIFAGAYDNAASSVQDFASSIRQTIDAIRSQTRAFAEFTGLFDIFERKHISGDRLMKRLQAQVRAMGEWQNSLVTIQAKGVSEQFLNALRMQGPGAVDQINALAKMSPDQLRQYESLYRQKYEIGGQQAVWANQAGRVESNEINLYITGNNISNEQDAARLANQIIGQLRLAGYGI
jgi:hypothetical protein